jgi:hypothetical protein
LGWTAAGRLTAMSDIELAQGPAVGAVFTLLAVARRPGIEKALGTHQSCSRAFCKSIELRLTKVNSHSAKATDGLFSSAIFIKHFLHLFYSNIIRFLKKFFLSYFYGQTTWGDRHLYR